MILKLKMKKTVRVRVWERKGRNQLVVFLDKLTLPNSHKTINKLLVRDSAEAKFVNSVLSKKQKVGGRTPALPAPYPRLTTTLTPPTKKTQMFLQNFWKRETTFWQLVYYLHLLPQTSEHLQPSPNDWLRLLRPTCKGNCKLD